MSPSYPFSPSLKPAPIAALLDQKNIWFGECSNSSPSEERSFLPNVDTISSQSISFGVPEIDSFLPHRGLERGALHEIVYNDRLQPRAIAKTLPAVLVCNAHTSLLKSLKGSLGFNSSREKPHLPIIAWIGKECWPTPLFLMMLSGGDQQLYSALIHRSLFINPQNEKSLLWSIETTLRNKAVDVIVAACPRISRVTTQRLALAAKNNRTTALLLRSAKDLSIPSCAASRWELEPIPATERALSWAVTLHKIRGASLHKKSWCLHLKESCPGLDTERPLLQCTLGQNINSHTHSDDEALPLVKAGR